MRLYLGSHMITHSYDRLTVHVMRVLCRRTYINSLLGLDHSFSQAIHLVIKDIRFLTRFLFLFHRTQCYVSQLFSLLKNQTMYFLIFFSHIVLPLLAPYIIDSLVHHASSPSFSHPSSSHHATSRPLPLVPQYSEEDYQILLKFL